MENKKNTKPIIFITGLRHYLDKLELNSLDQKSFYYNNVQKVKIYKQYWNNYHVIDSIDIEKFYKAIQNHVIKRDKYQCVVCHIYNQDIIEGLSQDNPYIVIHIFSDENTLRKEINDSPNINHIKQLKLLILKTTIYPLYLDNIHGLMINYYFDTNKDSIKDINKQIQNVIDVIRG